MDATTTCDECGFDGQRWSESDIERTLAHTEDLIGFVTAGWVDGTPEVIVGSDSTAGAGPLAEVHTLMHQLDRLAADRRSSDPFEAMIGSIAALHASDGGVPKRAIDGARVDASGLVGDRQGNRLHHGRPWQAICLYSAELIDQLSSEGHPIRPGSIGENLTLTGVDWARMRGGLTIEIGEVRLRTASPAAPCSKIGDSFLDRHWDRINHDIQPGWARWYASVLAGGEIARGDAVVVRA